MSPIHLLTRDHSTKLTTVNAKKQESKGRSRLRSSHGAIRKLVSTAAIRRSHQQSGLAHPLVGQVVPPSCRKLNVSPGYHTRYGIYSNSMSHTIEDKHKLLLRAKRIQGQVEALVRALTEERDCSDVLQLMSAARGAMNSLMAELLEGHIRSHVLIGKQKPTSAQVLAADEVIDMVKSYLR
jgi:DNA-binding FrmR family transcriptional regulator